MDDKPPPYEHDHSGRLNTRRSRDTKNEDRQCSLVDQATASRSMLVSAAAEEVHAVLERRALYGISRTTMVLIPSDHGCNLSGEYRIAEFDEKPISIELTGEVNRVEFWSQTQALEELQRQVASSVGGGRGATVQVRADELHVRYETRFGLYDTMSIKAIVVDVR